MIRATLISFGLLASSGLVSADESAIPKPEHPRPDARRPFWANLNGRWEFRFDANDQGTREGWEKPDAPGYDRTIVVPFPWESELSGIHQVKDAPKVGWYRRRFTVPKEFSRRPARLAPVRRGRLARRRLGQRPEGRRARGRLYALRGRHLRRFDALRPKTSLVVRAFDPTDPNLPTGKQVGWYTPSSGIWQTVWLEARPKTYIAGFHVVTAIQPASVKFIVDVAGFDKVTYQLGLGKDQPSVDHGSVTFDAGNSATAERAGEKPTARATIESKVRDPQLWAPENPQLYDVTLELKDATGKVIDSIETYFGLRTISRGKYGDQPFERILLNGKPLYLRAALDQSFNPKGLYTAPDDDFFKRDMIIAKAMGLNGLRIHIKPDEPRRLYWADRMGVLIMEDMPNTWRQTPQARIAWERTMREAVVRDRNHPSIIAWVAFNETWGLGKPEDYKKDRDTQAWVARMVDLIRGLDGRDRLVEDNSPCNYDHIVNTDLNSWHFYIDNHDASPAAHRRRRRQDRARQRLQLLPGPDPVEPSLDQFGIRRGLGRWRRPRHLLGPARLDHATAPAAQDSRVRLYRAHRHRVGAQRTGELRPDAEAFRLRHLAARHAAQRIAGRRFHRLRRTSGDRRQARTDDHGPDLRQPLSPTARGPSSCDGGSAVTIPVPTSRWLSRPRSIPITWRPYDVVDLEPLKFTLPDYPFVGALFADTPR